MHIGPSLMRIAGARNYRFFYATLVAHLSMIIRIVYHNNYVSGKSFHTVAIGDMYEVLTTNLSKNHGAYHFPKYPSWYTRKRVLIRSSTVICRDHFRHLYGDFLRGVLSGWLVRSFRDPEGTNLHGSDMDHKGGDVSHGIIAPSCDYSPSSHVNPRFPRDSQYRNIRQPSGFTTHAAPKHDMACDAKFRDTLANNRNSRTKIEITRIRVTLSKSFKLFGIWFSISSTTAFYWNKNLNDQTRATRQPIIKFSLKRRYVFFAGSAAKDMCQKAELWLHQQFTPYLSIVFMRGSCRRIKKIVEWCGIIRRF